MPGVKEKFVEMLSSKVLRGIFMGLDTFVVFQTNKLFPFIMNVPLLLLIFEKKSNGCEYDNSL